MKQLKFSKRFISILVFIIIVLAGSIAVWQYNANLDYIDGNTLNLPYVNNWNDDDLLDNPWKNSQFHISLMYRSLFLSDSSFETVTCDLADEYHVSQDGLDYQITLKNNVLWSDGEPLTVDDIIFSFESVLQSKTANGLYLAAFSKIEGYQAFIQDPSSGLSGIEVTGNNSFEIHLTTPHPTMMQVLAQFTILPEHSFIDADIPNIDLNEYWKNPVVNGMYKVGEVVSYKTVQLVQNDYYSEEKPKIDEVILHMNYKFANLDYYSTNNITEIINYRSMRCMQEHKVDLLFYRYFVFNLAGAKAHEDEISAMQDLKVREAISLAIDREGLLYDIYFDSGSIIESGVPSTYPSYSGQSITYDPQKAAALLEESDYDVSRPLTLAYYYTDTTSMTFMEAVAANLEAIGFQVELSFMSTATELYSERNYDLLLKGLSAFDVSEWYFEYSNDNPNLSRLLDDNSSFDPLVRELSTTTDTARKTELLQELQQMEAENLFKLPLFTLSQVLYINEDRVNLPSNCTFGNTWYKYDVDFEKWSIKKS